MGKRHRRLIRQACEGAFGEGKSARGGAGRKEEQVVMRPFLGRHTRRYRTGFSYQVEVQVGAGIRLTRVSRVNRVVRPPVVQEETRGDSGEVARSSCSSRRSSVEECVWQLVWGRARPTHARNSVDTQWCGMLQIWLSMKLGVSQVYL